MVKKENLEVECPTNISGVYYLYNKSDEVIYIGISRNCVRQRLRSHLITDSVQFNMPYYSLIKKYVMRKDCVSFSFIPLDARRLDTYEREQIRIHKPKYNVCHNRHFDYKVAEEEQLTPKEILLVDMVYYQVDNASDLYKIKERKRIQSIEFDDMVENL